MELQASMLVKFKEINTASNYLSIFRLLLTIPIYYFVLRIETTTGARGWSLILLGVAGLTDYLDGWLARKYNKITEFGKLIDPLADKVLVAVVVLALFNSDQIPDYYFWIIILRDAVIFVGGMLLSKKIGRILPSNLLGKITVFFISLYLFWVIIGFNSPILLGQILFYLSIALSFASVIGYGIRAIETLKWHSK